MLTREQVHALFCMRMRRSTIWSAQDKQLIPYLSQVSMSSFSTDSEIAKLLHCIAFGDLQSAQVILTTNPRLVLQSGHVTTPSGLNVMHTTPLECALGACDPEMAKMIAPYFDQYNGGEAVRETQYARYRLHIDKMLQQKPYDFSLLLTALKQATPADVAAALRNDMLHASALLDVLEQFRKEFTPGKIIVGMHFNYQHLLRALVIYDQEYEHFHHENADKNRLFVRQVIGFIQRSLPAIDRMIISQNANDAVEMKTATKRSFTFKHDDFDFPVTTDHGFSRSGLGFEYYAADGRAKRGASWSSAGGSWKMRQLISDKNLRLAALTRPPQEAMTSWCVIC
jgi:hypothetical protein